jgi:hypothetical protein
MLPRLQCHRSLWAFWQQHHKDYKKIKKCSIDTAFGLTASFFSFFPCRDYVAGMQIKTPSDDADATIADATAFLNRNSQPEKDGGGNEKNEKNLETASQTADLSVPSPSSSVEKPATLTLHNSGSSQDLQLQAPAVILATPAPPEEQPLAAATSRLQVIKAAGASLVGRSSVQGGPSKYRGVVWHKSNSKWEARIYEAGKQRFLGYFSIEDEAALIYDDYAARIHGTNAKLNFPETYYGVELPKPPHVPAPARSHPSGLRCIPTAAGGGGGAIRSNANLLYSGVAEGVGRDVSSQSHSRHGYGGAGHRVQPVKGSSSFRGVSWNSNCQKWRAQVWKGSDVHHLGYFGHEEDAARAYDKGVLRIRGPDAPINFPRSDYGIYNEQQQQQHQYQVDVLSDNAAAAALVAALGAGGGGFHSFSQYSQAAARSDVNVTDNLNNNNTTTTTTNTTTPKEATTIAMKVAGDGSSEMLGVSWSSYHNAWIAEIWDGKKYQLLGSFSTESQAAKAYDIACISQHGTDALTNFPVENYPSESAALALLGISHDLHGSEEFYANGRRSRSATPPISTKDAAPTTAAPAVEVAMEGGDSGDEERAVSLSFPTTNSLAFARESTPTVAFGARKAAVEPASTSVVNVEEFAALYGQLQNFVAQQQHQQQQQTLPVAPLQSSAAAACPQQQQQPVGLSENAQNTLMALMQAAISHHQQQQQQQQESVAAAVAAAAREHLASQQRLAFVTAALQNWAHSQQQRVHQQRVQQQQHQQQQSRISIAPVQPAITLKRDFSNFSCFENSGNFNAGAVAAAYQAILAQQMNAAKRPRV